MPHNGQSWEGDTLGPNQMHHAQRESEWNVTKNKKLIEINEITLNQITNVFLLPLDFVSKRKIWSQCWFSY